MVFNTYPAIRSQTPWQHWPNFGTVRHRACTYKTYNQGELCSVANILDGELPLDHIITIVFWVKEVHAMRRATESAACTDPTAPGLRGSPSLGILFVGPWTVIDFREIEELTDEATVRRVGEQLDQLIESGHDWIVIDLQKIRRMSGHMLGVLARVHCKIGESNGSLRLCNPDRSIRNILGICGLDHIFTIFDRDVDAVGGPSHELW